MHTLSSSSPNPNPNHSIENQQFTHPKALPERPHFCPVEIVESAAGQAPIELTTHPSWVGLSQYEKYGGYTRVDAIRNGSVRHEVVMDMLESSALRGLGGAGFPFISAEVFIAYN